MNIFKSTSFHLFDGLVFNHIVTVQIHTLLRTLILLNGLVTPEAPHFGGYWERLVRSVKKVLNQFVFPKRPTDEILTSTFAEIKLILNSRTLIYMPLDDEMTEPMTPNLLLLGTPDGSKPPAVFCDSPAALKLSWKMAQHAADVFWKKWLAEYPAQQNRAVFELGF